MYMYEHQIYVLSSTASSIDLQDYENLGVASTFKNLILMFPVSLLEALPRELLTLFINHMTQLTCDIGKNAAMEEAVSYHPLCTKLLNEQLIFNLTIIVCKVYEYSN